MKKFLLVCFAAIASPSLAFRDDFDGDRLGDWWSFFSETGAKMEYYLAAGWLHVTRIHGLVDGKSVYMYARTEDWPSDFQLTARLVWEGGPSETLGAGILDLPPRDAAGGLLYYRGWDQQICAVFTGEGSSYSQAPPAGVHVFRMIRKHQSIRMYVDDTFVFSKQNVRDHPLRFAEFIFGGRDNESFKGLQVDYIEVTEIPEPVALGWSPLLLPAIAGLLRARAVGGNH